MAVFTLALAAITVGALSFGLPFLLLTDRPRRSSRRGWLEQRRTERLIVHTSDDQTFEGCVREVGRDGITLAAVQIVNRDGGVPVGGDVWIPRHKVVFVQQPPAS